MVRHDAASDQVAADHEKHIDAREPSRELLEARVEQDNGDYRQSSEAVYFRSILQGVTPRCSGMVTEILRNRTGTSGEARFAARLAII